MNEAQKTEMRQGESFRVEEVLSRVEDPKYALASALMAIDGPLVSVIPEVRDDQELLSAIKVSLSEEQIAGVMTLVGRITGESEDKFRQESTQKSGEEIEDEEQRAEYVGQLERGIALFVENGFLDQRLVDEMRENLLDPEALKLVDAETSDFSIISYDFPDRPLGINLASQHVKNCEARIKGFLSGTSVESKLSDGQIHMVAAQMALMHEFGHGVNSFFITKMTHHLAQEAGEIWETLDSKSKYKYYNQAYDAYYAITEAEVADGRADLLEDIFDKNEIEDTYTESVSVGSENIALKLGLKDQGLSEDEINEVMKGMEVRYQHKVEDFLYFARMVKDTGLNPDQYHNLMLGVSEQTRRAGFDIRTALPYYSFGYNGKQTGYILPFGEQAFKDYARAFTDLAFEEKNDNGDSNLNE